MSKIMAHRGARNLWAENSLTGFRNILPHGFEAVEFDVHLTDAGELVVIHDTALDRTTNGTGPTRSLTPDARRALRLRDPAGNLTEDHPPVLAEVLELFAEDPAIELWIELKSDADGRPYPGLAEKVVQAVRAAGLSARSALHSFDPEVVQDLRAIAPEIRRLQSVHGPSAEAQGGLAAVIARAEGLADILGIHHELFEAEYDLIARTWGVERASVWTINTPELMQSWIARKPAWLVSDDPVLLKSLMKKETA